MDRYFAKRTEGDFSETQRIKAEVGHATLVKKAYCACARREGVGDARLFFVALRSLLVELGKRGYTQHPDGWHVTGGRFQRFDGMSAQQIFAKWASVQQTIAKWIFDILPSNIDLYAKLLEGGLVFKANDLEAVITFLMRFLRLTDSLFDLPTEGLEKRAFKVLMS